MVLTSMLQGENVARRELDLKTTELYTWKFVDEIHLSLHSSSNVCSSLYSCIYDHVDSNYIPASQVDADKVVEGIIGQDRVKAYELSKCWRGN